MSELVTDLKNLEIETLKNLKSSKASNTLKAYKSDYKDFAIFCSKNNGEHGGAWRQVVSQQKCVNEVPPPQLLADCVGATHVCVPHTQSKEPAFRREYLGASV